MDQPPYIFSISFLRSPFSCWAAPPMKGHGMNNITDGPSLVSCITEEGTHLLLNGGDSPDAIAALLTPLNDDAVKATENVGLSAGTKVPKSQDINAEILLMDMRDRTGIPATGEAKEGESVPAQLKIPLNQLGQIPQPSLFQPQYSRLIAHQLLQKKRRKLFQSCY